MTPAAGSRALDSDVRRLRSSTGAAARRLQSSTDAAAVWLVAPRALRQKQRLLRPVRVAGPKCVNVTCVQCENGKPVSPIDSAQPTMAHDADTDSDLARPPDGKHPSVRHAAPAMLLRSATSRLTAGHVVAHPGPSDSE
jgi:hypothetical protein